MGAGPETYRIYGQLVQLVMVKGLRGVQFGLWSYEWLTESDNREVGLRFVNYEYDYRQNWTKLSPVTDKSRQPSFIRLYVYIKKKQQQQ